VGGEGVLLLFLPTFFGIFEGVPIRDEDRSIRVDTVHFVLAGRLVIEYCQESFAIPFVNAIDDEYIPRSIPPQ